MTKAIKKVGIIGAGPSGLAQLKNLLETSKLPGAQYELQIKVFESKPDVGGVWYSTEQAKHYRKAVVRDTGRDDVEKGKVKGKEKEKVYIYPPDQEEPSPMYEGLHTNLPHELMAFRDFPFPDDTSLFPDRRMVHKYFQDYAKHFNLLPHISFNHRVEKLYQDRDTSAWAIEYKDIKNETLAKDDFDYVCVSNGHYEDGWIPDIPDLSNFPGEILHSIYYLRPEDYISRTVLVVGSFASGSDLARQLASLNIDHYSPDGRPLSEGGKGFTKVYVSCSSPPETNDPWTPYITYLPLISHLDSNGRILFDDHDAVDGVDTIIFATGYNFSLPFCKITDYPWCDEKFKVLDEVIQPEERTGGKEQETGGMKGLSMDRLDELMLFLEADHEKSLAFPTLQYQIVPFPLVETQTRLTALLWSGAMASLPTDLQLPPNPSNPFHSNHEDTKSSNVSGDKVKPRKVVQMRKKLVFGASYEFLYLEYLMSLMESSDDPKWIEGWWAKQDVKKGWRADTTLRRRTLGY